MPYVDGLKLFTLDRWPTIHKHFIYLMDLFPPEPGNLIEDLTRSKKRNFCVFVIITPQDKPVFFNAMMKSMESCYYQEQDNSVSFACLVTFLKSKEIWQIQNFYSYGRVIHPSNIQARDFLEFIRQHDSYNIYGNPYTPSHTRYYYELPNDNSSLPISLPIPSISSYSTFSDPKPENQTEEDIPDNPFDDFLFDPCPQEYNDPDWSFYL